MKKTGEILKKAREEKQLSIHEIGLSLKINSKVLKAIEEGDVDSLPAKTFLRGFVQSYAQYLKLNVDEVLRLFTSEMGTTKPHTIALHLGTEKPTASSSPSTSAAPPDDDIPAMATPAKEAPTSMNEPKSVTITSGKRFRNVTLIGSVIVLITLILITKRVIDRYQNEAITPEPETIAVTPSVTPQPVPQVESAPPSPDASAAQQAAPPETTAPLESSSSKEGATEPATPFVNPTTTGAAPRSAMTSPPPAPVSTPPPPATPPVGTTANNTASKPPETKPAATPASPKPAATTTLNVPKPVETPKPVVNEKPEIKPEASATTAEVKPPVKNIELIIEALDTVDVEYSTASGKNEKFHLEPEQLHTIKTRSGVKLNVSNGGAISIIVNGKEIGIPGVLGKPIKLTY